MGANGVVVNQLNGGLGRTNPTDDGVVMIIIGGAVAASGLALKTAKEYLDLVSVETDGITSAFDDNEDLLAHYHLSEYFRVNPSGKIVVVLDDDTLTTAELKAMLRINSTVKAIGFVRNSATAPVDFAAYIAGKQTLISELKAENRNIAVALVEGKEFSDATAISAYTDLRTLSSGNVVVVIAQDPVIRALKEAYETHACIGTALGAISVRSVNENLGSVDVQNKPNFAKGNRDYPLTDIASGRFLSACLQSGKNVSDLTANELTALNDKGYISVINYNAYAGFYFSDSHTATAKSSDYCRIENNRVWNKAADLIIQALMPRVKGNIKKDPQTGYLRDIECKELEALAKKQLSPMEAAGECSGYDVYIDPKQTLSNDQPMVVKAEVVLNDIIHQFTVNLGLTNQLS